MVEGALRFIQVEDEGPPILESLSGHLSERLLVVVSLLVFEEKSFPEIKDMALSIAGSSLF